MNSLVTKTKWNCEKCKKSGTMITPVHVGFWSGYEQLKIEHRKISPDCKFDPFKIRVTLVDEKREK